jgi:hypothetical protein
VGPDLVQEELVNAFVQLLKDNEAEVRTAGASGIPGWYQLRITKRNFQLKPDFRLLQTP